MKKIPDELWEIAKKKGLTKNAIYIRLRKGMPMEEAIHTPPVFYPKLYDQYRSIAEANGIGESTFRTRIHRGKTPEQAASTPNKRARNFKPGDKVVYKGSMYQVKEVFLEFKEAILLNEKGEEVFAELKNMRKPKERTMNLPQLYKEQEELDQFIAKNLDININHVDYVDDRVTALKVEMAEFANEVGFFKYWKQSHVMDLERTLEEWADVAHFFLSVGISRNYHTFVRELNYKQWHKVPLKHLFNYIMESRIESAGQWKNNFEQLVQIGVKLGFTIEQMELAYYLKKQKNIERQMNKY
jgi:dimeric dUTPase (all-alpha-NTP-PPase superfamily)